MYADREEEALEQRRASALSSRRDRRGNGRSSPSSSVISRSISRSRSRSRSPVRIHSSSAHSRRTRASSTDEEDELRKRAILSRGSKRSSNVSPPPASRSDHSPPYDQGRRRRDRHERRRGKELIDRVEDSDEYERRGTDRHRYAPTSRSNSHYDDGESDTRRGSQRGNSVRRESPDGRDEEGFVDRRSPRGYEDDRNYVSVPRRPHDRYGPPPRRGYYDRPPRRYTRSPSPPPRRRDVRPKSPDFEDVEQRSIFCSQLAARLSQRDLGEFFEDHLGYDTVLDVKIVMDKITRRSKGIGYVELRNEELVERALELSKKPLFGIPILIQRTDAAKNRVAGSTHANSRYSEQHFSMLSSRPIHIDPSNVSGASARLYFGNVHFHLTEEDIKAVFEPFGPIISVDLHREPGSHKSKGFGFVQFVNSEHAMKAIEHMNGFELAGRPIKVGQVNSSRSGVDMSGSMATETSSFDEGGGGGLDATSRAALMEKLARSDQASSSRGAVEQQRPSSIPQTSSKGILLKNMFNPEEETERGWDNDLADDIKEECEAKYGKVNAIKVDADSMGEVWIRFADAHGAKKALNGLNGRFFGGRSISASFVSEGILSSMLG